MVYSPNSCWRGVTTNLTPVHQCAVTIEQLKGVNPWDCEVFHSMVAKLFSLRVTRDDTVFQKFTSYPKS